MKSLESTKNKMAKDENVPHLEIAEVVLVHCNIVNIDYQQDSRVLHTFVHNKSFGQLLDISRKTFILLKIFYLEFSFINVWVTYQNSKPLGIEDKININLIIT